MAGQGPSRRELLHAIAVASAASAFVGFGRWSYAYADEKIHNGMVNVGEAVTRTAYLPRFFTVAEYRLVDVLSALILPATPAELSMSSKPDSSKVQPGAREAGVSEFIDFMVFSDPSLQEPFRKGLQWMNHASGPSASFVDLPSEQQDALLQRLAYAAKHRADEKDGQEFFKLMRRYTVIGYYTSRVGLEALDYPGLTFYGASPGCTHPNNPEHAGLS